MTPSTLHDIDSAFRGALRLRLGQIGIVMLSAIAGIRYAVGQTGAATVDLAWAIALAAALVWLRHVRNSAALGTFMAAVSVGGSLAKIHLLGATGVAWMFPIVLGTFAVTTRMPAAIVSGIGVAWASVAASMALGMEMALSVSIPLVLTYIVAYVTTTHVESLRRGLEGLASRDALTGAGNRRALDAALGPLLSDDAVQATAVALMDLDHFKSVNDLHGHSTGDRVLVEFAALVRRLTRPQDRLFRFGGEEFVLVMPMTSADEARDVAGRINAAVRATTHVRQSPVTVSIGLALARGGETVDALLARADAGLYAAKKDGRDRVVLA